MLYTVSSAFAGYWALKIGETNEDEPPSKST